MLTREVFNWGQRDHVKRWMETDPGRALPALAGFAALVVVLALALTPAIAQGSYAYWVSMRGVASEVKPGFVPLSPVATSSFSVAFAGCRGRTWYLQPASAASVQAARMAGETVQIHRGPAGSQPAGSMVICLIQADG